MMLSCRCFSQGMSGNPEASCTRAKTPLLQLAIFASRHSTMDLGSNFSAKVEPFLLVAKSVKGAAAAKLIQDATSAPGVFVFSELLELPNIQEVHLAALF
jgi:hypothetical protein